MASNSNVNAKTIRELERLERQGVLDLSRCFFGDPVPGTVLLICADPKALLDAPAYVCAVCDSVAEAQQDQANMMRTDWEDGKGWRKYAIVRVKCNPIKTRYVYYLDRDEYGSRLYNVWSPLRRDFVSVLVDQFGEEWITESVHGYQPRTMAACLCVRWVMVEEMAAGGCVSSPMKPGLDVLDGDECDGIALIDWNDSEEFGHEELYKVDFPIIGNSISVYVCDGVEYLPADMDGWQPSTLMEVGDMESGWYIVEEFATLYEHIYS